MPVISITMGRASKEQKKALVERLTSVAMEVTQIPANHFVVTINEIGYDSLGLGGRTVEEIRLDQS